MMGLVKAEAVAMRAVFSMAMCLEIRLVLAYLELLLGPVKGTTC
jgi:hypothetical protein